MSSSRPHVGGRVTPASTANGEGKFTATDAFPLFSPQLNELPGAMNDAPVIRVLLVDAIKRCNKSRTQLAEEMTYYLGTKVTETQLNGFTAGSRQDWRWPAEWDRAFCAATGDDRLLRLAAELAGYTVITAEEKQLLELGRQYLAQKKAARAIAQIEAEIEGGL